MTHYHHHNDPPPSSPPPITTATPTLDTMEFNVATPIARHPSSKQAEMERPLRQPTLTVRSASLLEMASMYQPDEPTQLTVDDGLGHFQNISLTTPTIISFTSKYTGFGTTESKEHHDEWLAHRQAIRHSKGKSVDLDRMTTLSELNGHVSLDLQRSKSTIPDEHPRRLRSDSNASTSALGRRSSKRRSSGFISEDKPDHAGEPSSQRISTSSSTDSFAESAGTAADASDSEYEEKRSQSVSRASSRRPSLQSNSTDPKMKRLSSFAPVPALPEGHALQSSTVAIPHTGLGPAVAVSGVHTNGAMDQRSHSTASSASSSGATITVGQHSDPSEIAEQSKTSQNANAFDARRKEVTSGRVNKIKTSVLETVISKTRQKDLPPKEPEEDKRHLKQFQAMMLASREADKARRAASSQRRAQKDKAAAAASSIWQKDILPNWKSVLRDEKLQKTWWSGTMPAISRGRLWQGCIGNGLAIGKASFARATLLAQTLSQTGKFPQSIIDEIDSDVAQVLPQTKLFQYGCPLHDDLRSLLLAQSVFWKSNTPTYMAGTACPAAMLLITMPPPEAFLCLVNLINKSVLKVFYLDVKEDVAAYYRVFSTLLADKMPKVYRNFVAHDIRPSLYLRPWLATAFVQFLGFETVTRIWDIFVLEGDQFLFRLALAILQIFEARLFNPDHAELTDLFSGADKGARAIVARDTGRIEAQVHPWEVYELIGAHEDELFAVMGTMEWKEGTFHRLLLRELPDVVS